MAVFIPLAVAGGVAVGGAAVSLAFALGIMIREIHRKRRAGAALDDDPDPADQQGSPQPVLRRVAANGVSMVCAHEAASVGRSNLRHVQVS